LRAALAHALSQSHISSTSCLMKASSWKALASVATPWLRARRCVASASACCPAAEQGELPAQPFPEQREQLVRLVLRGMCELRQLGAQCSDRAAIALYVGPVRNQDVDESSDSISGLLALGLPARQHLPRGGEACRDDGVQDLVLGFEVMVEIAARDPHDIRNIREGRVLVALPIEQLVGGLYDVIPGRLVAHEKALPLR
jgi:hypothetical protein